MANGNRWKPDTRRGRLYNSPSWRALRAAQLEKEPLCAFCAADGRVVAANIVDHIIPHKGDHHLFFDPKNLQSLCTPCHDNEKKRMERGKRQPVNEDGLPLHWQLEDG